MDKKRLAFYLTLFGAVLLNNWLLGFVFNRHLLFAGGSVSEFSALSQPHQMLFRCLDIASGLLLAAGFGLMLTRQQIRRSRFWNLLSIGGLVLGLSNCIDAILPLPCSGTVDQLCNAPVRIDWHRISLPDHAFSSTVIALCFLLIPVATILYARLVNRSRLAFLGWLALIPLLIFFGALATSNHLLDSLTGLSQEVQLIMFSAALIYLAKIASS